MKVVFIKSAISDLERIAKYLQTNYPGVAGLVARRLEIVLGRIAQRPESAQRVPGPPVTIAEYDAFVEAQGDDSRWELVAGEIIAMTNPTETHEQIVANLGAQLKLAMDEIGCRTFYSGIAIQRSDSTDATDKPRPDIVVRCGPVRGLTYVTDPLIVVEVLSPSTMDVDRGFKLHFFKRLPTLRHIAFVYQEPFRIEHYRKTDKGWVLEVLTQPDEQLCFEAVRFCIELSRVYFGVDLRPE